MKPAYVIAVDSFCLFNVFFALFTNSYFYVNRNPAGAVPGTRSYIHKPLTKISVFFPTCSAVVENVDRKLALRAFCGVLGSATRICNTKNE